MRLPRGQLERAAAFLVALGFTFAVPARSESLALLPPLVGVTDLYASNARSGLALVGLDPLTYWLDTQPRPGRPTLEFTHGGLVWRFASQANRTAFMENPDAFLPKFGGFDAVHVASGVAVTADPSIYVTRSGSLYFFRNAANRDLFASQPSLALEAEARWPVLQASLVKG